MHMALTSMEIIPFKVGQHVEECSFISGYCGAWFQCKIREITTRNGTLGFIPEYPSFPGQEKKWTELYQVPPYCMGNAKLMLRPQYPPIYNEKQTPNVNEISEVIVIVCDSWKVGDLVDGLYDYCYWSGRITRLFRQKAKIELTPPPHGEGSSCSVPFKDIRPSLDWSLEYGWTIPTLEGGTDPCARLLKPIKQGQETEVVEKSRLYRLPFSFPISSNSVAPSVVKRKRTIVIRNCSLGSLAKKHEDGEKNSSYGHGDSSRRITNCVDASSRHHTTTTNVDVGNFNSRNRNFKVNGGGTSNSKRSGTLEASILDLEECLNKVKWLKKILKYGISSTEAQRPQWVAYEPRGA